MQKIHPDAQSLYQEALWMLEERLDDLKEPPKEGVRLADFDLADFDFKHHFLQKELSELTEKSQKLIISHLQLQNSKDPRTTLLRLGKALVGDGLLMATLLGDESFKEFKEAFAALGETRGAPLPDVRDVGGVLTNLQFALPVVDRELISLEYPDFKSIYADMQILGLKNSAPLGVGLQGKQKWQKMEEYYKKYFMTAEGMLKVSIELIFISAYRPHKSQPKPLKPGAAEISLTEILNK